MSESSGEVLSVAIFDALPGHEEDAATTMRELMQALASKGYSRDQLYRDGANQNHFVLLRYWRSEDARQQASEDPEIHKFWARLGNLIQIVRIYETLHEAK